MQQRGGCLSTPHCPKVRQVGKSFVKFINQPLGEEKKGTFQKQEKKLSQAFDTFLLALQSHFSTCEKPKNKTFQKIPLEIHFCILQVFSYTLREVNGFLLLVFQKQSVGFLSCLFTFIRGFSGSAIQVARRPNFFILISLMLKNGTSLQIRLFWVIKPSCAMQLKMIQTHQKSLKFLRTTFEVRS